MAKQGKTAAGSGRRQAKRKSKSARERKRLTATAQRAFPGGSKKTRREIQRVVPPAQA